MSEDDMELTTTATITRIGDEYFLPINADLLKALECATGDAVEFTVQGNRLIVTRRCED
jgi:antitoxin component of MazEF toxin-antitoxin module